MKVSDIVKIESFIQSTRRTVTCPYCGDKYDVFECYYTCPACGHIYTHNNE